MNFDRNTVFGFVALAVLFIGFFYFTSKERNETLRAQAVKDSIAQANAPKPDTSAVPVVKAADDTSLATAAVGFEGAEKGTEQLTTVSTELATYSFSNKGGQLRKVELKKFNNQQGNPVQLIDPTFDKIEYPIAVNANKTVSIDKLFFGAPELTKNSDGSQKVRFTLSPEGTGKSVIHEFTVRPDDYMVDFTISLQGADQLLSQGKMNLVWTHRADQMEKDLTYEKRNSQIGYNLDGEFDYHTAQNKEHKDFEKSVEWVAVKQQFFNTTLLAKNHFSSGSIDWTVPKEEDKKDSVVLESTANLQLAVPGPVASVPLQIYYGPNDYKILKKYGNEMENLVNLGQGIYSFVKYINRWIVIPVFDFLKGFIDSYGIVILLLTIFIRLLTSPLMYPGYKTSAQMKILRPELAKLKEKYPDQQQYAMEQMKFMREAGVNQFAGCLPGLLQIPIFFALYSFFNSSVALRGQPFLWADDLSSYDSILNFGFHVPLYGDHVSLFTLTAIAGSFLISLYSMSATPDQGNPVMKYMPYIFPFFLLFIFNNLPSALTWYYTVSNIITLGLQMFIQKFVIDHDKLVAKMEANRKKPKTKSKWQEQMEKMQESQKRMKEMQDRNKK